MQVFRRRTSKDTPFLFSELELRQQEFKQKLLKYIEPAGGLFLSETAPAVTVGRAGFSSEPVLPANLETVRLDRGGFETYHGPGQWILYIVARMADLVGDRRSVRKVVDGLLDVGRNTARECGVELVCRAGRDLGLWNTQGQKVISLGINTQEGVLTHGIALNVFRTEQSFLGVSPCGLKVEPGFLFVDPTRGVEAFESVGDLLIRNTLKIFSAPN